MEYIKKKLISDKYSEKIQLQKHDLFVLKILLKNSSTAMVNTE